MPHVVVVIPRKDGWEAPAGREMAHPFDSSTTIAGLVAAIGKALDFKDLTLSVALPDGPVEKLAQLDPTSEQLASEILPDGARLFVGDNKA